MSKFGFTLATVSFFLLGCHFTYAQNTLDQDFSNLGVETQLNQQSTNYQLDTIMDVVGGDSTSSGGSGINVTHGFNLADSESVKIVDVTPKRGPTTGGMTITITGSSFSQRPTVTVGGEECTQIDYLSETKLTCVTPAHEVGVVDVVCDTPVQEPAVLEKIYEYYPPFEVFSISPNWGADDGGEEVTIEGADFLTGTTYTVTLGGVACIGVAVGNEGKSLTCNTGAYDTGEATEVVVDVEVSDGVMAVILEDAYEYLKEIYLTLKVDDPKISLNLLPQKNGIVTSASHQVTVSTNSHVGYTLSLANKTIDDLIGKDSGAKIPPSAGTIVAPIKLAKNTWGFAWSADGATGFTSSGFDSTYTAEDNNLNSTSLWAGVSTTAITVRKASDQRKSGERSEIFYAANADFTQAVDIYTNTVLYTAIVN
jgi:hypothetical protein